MNLGSEVNESSLQLGYGAQLVPALAEACFTGPLFGQVLLTLLLEAILALVVQRAKGERVTHGLGLVHLHVNFGAHVDDWHILSRRGEAGWTSVVLGLLILIKELKMEPVNT